MAKTKVKLDPPGVRRALDVGGPSGPSVKTMKLRNKMPSASDFLKEKAVATSTVLAKKPKHKHSSPVNSDDSQISSSESSDELISIWGSAHQPEPAQNLPRSPVITPQPRPTASSPSGIQRLDVTADIHCPQGGNIAVRKQNKDAPGRKQTQSLRGHRLNQQI
jgi:hypothetical protein